MLIETPAGRTSDETEHKDVCFAFVTGTTKTLLNFQRGVLVYGDITQEN